MKYWILACALMLVSAQPGAQQLPQHHLLIISGIGGNEEYRKQFSELSTSLYQAATNARLEQDNIILLTESTMNGALAADGISNKTTIQRVLTEISRRAAPGDRIFIVLIGHGTPRGDSAVFNLPGPDISAAEFATALAQFEHQTLIVINTASASGPFIDSLTQDNRIVITATSSGREYNATLFGGFFISAFARPGADRDKDERISMLEAFDYARREVRRSYENDKRLLSEHALLDDNGDGLGSLDPGEDKPDGVLANRIYFQQPVAMAGTASGELARLALRKQALVSSIAEFKKRRHSMAVDDYYDQLEVMLVDLALLSRQMRALGG